MPTPPGGSDPSNPVSLDDSAYAALRADIRRLGDLLGQTLARQEGPDLLDLVEQVRTMAREDGPAAARLLAEADPTNAIRLARAFSTYFHLANITEQVHRGRALARQRTEHGGWLTRAADRIAEAGLPITVLAEAADRLDVRPVLTAHPTEAARRSILTKLVRVAGLLDARAADGADPRIERRLAEVVDLLWQTDELRRERPEPVDEARNAFYYLDELAAG
ncbi:MAG: phosphoenolpyruvate carboxylase, partial [Actinomycetes bacterium]